MQQFAGDQGGNRHQCSGERLHLAKWGTGASSTIVARWIGGGSFEAVVSEPLLEECRKALSAPRIAGRYAITPDEIISLLSQLRGPGALMVELGEIAAVVPDPGDNVVLATAVAGRADYIVTGDKPLLALERYRGIPIVPPVVFQSLLTALDIL